MICVTDRTLNAVDEDAAATQEFNRNYMRTVNYDSNLTGQDMINRGDKDLDSSRSVPVHINRGCFSIAAFIADRRQRHSRIRKNLSPLLQIACYALDEDQHLNKLCTASQPLTVQNIGSADYLNAGCMKKPHEPWIQSGIISAGCS